ncbi:MAG TPA: DUF2516 family protein [Micromonosporaceae bacterium]
MATVAAPIFYTYVLNYLDRALLYASLVIEVYAFVNCLTQRADAFPAIGTLPKGAWLAITGGATLLTLLFVFPTSLLGLIGLAAAAVYLLDVRPALRDAVDGHGPW